MTIKHILLVLFTSASALLYGQEIREGIYYTSDKDIGLESEVFEFKDNNEFNYFLFGCTESKFGTGNYTIAQDSLYLRFIDSPDSKVQHDVKFTTSNSDSLKVNLKIVEYSNNDMLPGATGHFIKSKIGWTADMEGEISGTTVATNTSRTLRVQFIAFPSVDISIPANTTEIKGIVRFNSVKLYNSKDDLTFKITSIKNNRFKLTGNGQKDTTYKKMDQEQISEIVENRTGKKYEYFTN